MCIAHQTGNCRNAARAGRIARLGAIITGGYFAARGHDKASALDGGKTWQPAARPADDASTSTHAFADLVADASRFRLAWIDSRKGETGLRYAWTLDAGKSWSPNVTVDAMGLHYLSSRDAGKTWRAPRRMGSADARHSDLATSADGTLAAVWDDSGDNIVRAAISRDGGNTWSTTRQLSSRGNRAQNPRVIETGGEFHVFWTQAPAGSSTYEWKMATPWAR